MNLNNKDKKQTLDYRHSKLITGPLEIQYDITNKCNFRCLHCYNASGENLVIKNELSDNQALKLAKDLCEMKPHNLCFCGGEPLLRVDLLISMAKILKANVSNLSMVTNGYLLNENMLNDLINSGINRIQISLDGNTSFTHEKLRQKKDSFEYALNALKLCVANKKKLKEIMVCFIPTSFNTHEFIDLCSRINKLGIDTIRVQPLMALGRGDKNKLDIMPTNSQYRIFLRSINAVKSIYGKNFVQWGDPLDHIIRFRQFFTELTTNVGIKANGDISVTPYLPIVVGNVSRNSIKDYWNAGLPKVWSLPIIQECSKYYNHLDDFGKTFSNFPKIWKEEDFMYDLIEKNEK